MKQLKIAAIALTASLYAMAADGQIATKKTLTLAREKSSPPPGASSQEQCERGDCRGR
jgi:hypothetical protein